MRVLARRASAPPTAFVEGEPDLEPPEELALEVLDEAGRFQDDIDCELVDERDLDTDTADEDFDTLVHRADESEDDPDGAAEEFTCHGCLQVCRRTALGDPVDLLCRRCAR